jgi:hypothetical protein
MSYRGPSDVYVCGATINHAGRDQFNIQNTIPGAKPPFVNLVQISMCWSAASDLYGLLAPIDDAGYSRSGSVAVCLQGTREDVIGQIVQCIEDGHPICWLNGPAGSGKSAISQTVAERYAAQGSLSGSFFFLRGAGRRSTIASIIPTLAYQLSLSIPSTKPLILDVIRDEPGIIRQSLKHQFKKLLVKPILAVRNTPKPVVMVIDALDECDDKDLMAEFIVVVINAFRENCQLPFRIVMTSRVEEYIRKKLDAPAARLVINRLSLQDFDARLDIHKFLRSRFSTIYEENRRIMRSVSLPWPSESDLDTLANKSDGLFIFAITLMNFISNDGSGLPQEKLQHALTADAGLDTLYAQVLSDAPHDDIFERVIGTIMLVRYPLSITFLGHLLDRRAEHIVQALLGTQSIFMIPGDDDQPIRPFHTSLRDFLMAQECSGKFYINPPIRHLFIARDCLTAITFQPEEQIYGGGQKYACLNWCYHFHKGLSEAEDNLFDTLSSTFLTSCQNFFVSQTFDIWVNTLIAEGWSNTLDDLRSILSNLRVSTVLI